MKTITQYTLHHIIFLPSTLYKNTTILLPQLYTLKEQFDSAFFHTYVCSSYSNSDFSHSVFSISETNDIPLTSFFMSHSTYQYSNTLSLNDFKYFLSNFKTMSAINPLETLFISSADIELSFLKELKLPSVAYKNQYLPNQELFQTHYLFESISDFTIQTLSRAYQRFYHLPVTILNTRHLTLRELTVSDMKQLFKIYQEPSITRFIPTESDLKELEKKHESYIKNFYEFYEYGLWGVFLKDTNTLIGRCGVQQPSELSVDTKSIFTDTNGIILELSYMIDTHFQHQGYALEIAKAILNYAHYTLECHNIISFISPNNLPSIRLAQHLNMKPYKKVFHNGYDHILYYIDFKKKYLISREQTLRSFSNNPDTRVYGKRYGHSQKL